MTKRGIRQLPGRRRRRRRHSDDAVPHSLELTSFWVLGAFDLKKIIINSGLEISSKSSVSVFASVYCVISFL